MVQYIRSHLPFILLLIAVAGFILYFSLFTVIRYQKLYSHYFDLAIMHQTTYNSYMALKTGDMSRFLEMTDPHTSLDQVKRMSIHNDILLGLISPLYFIHDGPETLLILQVTVVAIGGYFIFLIAENIFKKRPFASWIACAFSLSYLLYPPLQKAVNFDFHAITLAPTFLLAMFYFGMKKRYVLSAFFAILTMTTKEQIGLVISLYGVYLLYTHISFKQLTIGALKRSFLKVPRRVKAWSFFLIASGLMWVVLSMIVIIPAFRGSEHFGAKYYSYLIENPFQIFSVVFRYETLQYLFIILAPAALLSILSPVQLLIAVSEFMTNILSSNGNMRNIYFHYDTALTAFVFISSMYGARRFLDMRQLRFAREKTLIIYVLFMATIFSLYMSPLPWGHHRETFLWSNEEAKLQDVLLWQSYLKDDQMKVSASGHIAPHFASRQYLYDFSGGYERAEYVIVDTWDIARGFQAEESLVQYARLTNDWRYIRIYMSNGIEVYKEFKVESPTSKVQ